MPAPLFPVTRRGEQSVNHFLESLRRSVGQKVLQLRLVGRQACQVECHTAKPGRPVGGSAWLELLLLELGKDEPVHRRLYPSGVLYGGGRGAFKIFLYPKKPPFR